MKRSSCLRFLPALLLLAPFALTQASEPASHDVSVPTTAGETVVIEWTGSALPGITGVGTTGGIVDPAAAIPCLPLGVDDAHTINLTVPEGIYEDLSITADITIEWDEGTEIPGVGTDPDLVLSVAQGATTLAYSDGGTPTESVGLTNPQSGAYKAIVCPYLATTPTAYRGKLTLTAVGGTECISGPSKALTHSTAASQSGLKDQELPGLANFDRHAVDTLDQLSPLPLNLQGRRGDSLFDRALGKTSFLWARDNAPVAAVGALNARELLVERARAHLRSEAKQLGLSRAMIDDAVAFDAQYNGKGPAVVRFRQRFNGRDVYQRSLNVLLDRANRPIAVSGYFATDHDVQADAAQAFLQTPRQAIAGAWRSLGGVLEASQLSRSLVKGTYEHFAVADLAGTHVFEREPRVKALYYPRAGRLVPAYYVELFARARVNGQLIAYGLVLSAGDGLILARKNLKSNAAYTYRAYAEVDGDFEPEDSPLGNGYTPFPGTDPLAELERVPGTSNLVTLEHAGISTGDPWLPDNATETLGNNVDACIDSFDTPVSGLISNPLNICTPILGDSRGVPNGPNSFDYMIVADSDPSTEDARQAAVVNIFYMTNWLHDIWYDHGFNEEAGNAQASNYGRGGEEGDRLLAQGQDASGRNNANMGTPADGASPTMQQYLFDGPTRGVVRQTQPTEGSPLKFVAAAFGADEYSLDAELVLADENDGDVTTDGCGITLPALPLPLVALPSIPALPQVSLAGKIALVDRGSCNFSAKAQFALLSGAAAMIVVNNTDAEPIAMSNADIPIGLPLPISPTDALYPPSVMIRKVDGEALKALLATGPVTMHMEREPSIDLDGTFDNQIIAHEFFHYVHHRLTDSSNQQSGAMSEGWGDINAFMLGLREGDTALPGNDKYQGAYGVAGYVVNNFYNGIRRAPYSTDFAKNAFTFKHLSDGEPTPDGGPGQTNSEVHNGGEIWANAVFECYVGILNEPRHSFTEARSRMRDYVIGGLKMTPANATFTEARDAILSVVLAADFEDYRACSDGFARRGMGRDAVAPSRSSTDLVGVVEDYSEFVCKVDGGGTTGGNGGGTPDAGRFGASALGLNTLLLMLGLGLLGLARRMRSV